MSNSCVNLGLLCFSNAEAVELASTCLEKQGFLFLDMTGDDNLMEQTCPVLNAAAAFLQGIGRGSGSKNVAVTGHVFNSFKDSIRLVSGNQYKSSDIPLLEKPVALERLEGPVRVLDKVSTEIVKALAGPLFDCSDVADVGKKYNLPLLLDPEAEERYGLVDIASYSNEKGAPDIVVSEHTDPGLLILALPEMGNGLELFSCNGDWISPLKDHRVLWAGNAAKKAGLVPALHRVCSRVGSPRVSCWHEICTSKQLAPPMLNKLEAKGMELEMDSIQGTKAVLEMLRKAEDHEPEATNLFASLFGYQHILPVPAGGRRDSNEQGGNTVCENACQD